METKKFYEYIEKGNKLFHLDTNDFVQPQIVEFLSSNGSSDDFPFFHCQEDGIDLYIPLANISCAFEGGFFKKPAEEIEEAVIVEEATTVEEKRAKGTWTYSCSEVQVNGETTYQYFMKCSNCGRSELRVSSKFEYCPHCGAEME